MVPDKTIDEVLDESGVNDPENQKLNTKYSYALTESRGKDKKKDYVSCKITLSMQKDHLYALFITHSNGQKMPHDNLNYRIFLWGRYE